MLGEGHVGAQEAGEQWGGGECGQLGVGDGDERDEAHQGVEAGEAADDGGCVEAGEQQVEQFLRERDVLGRLLGEVAQDEEGEARDLGVGGEGLQDLHHGDVATVLDEVAHGDAAVAERLELLQTDQHVHGRVLAALHQRVHDLQQRRVHQVRQVVRPALHRRQHSARRHGVLPPRDRQVLQQQVALDGNVVVGRDRRTQALQRRLHAAALQLLHQRTHIFRIVPEYADL